MREPTMLDSDREALRAAVELLHGVAAVFVRSARVTVESGGQTALERVVATYLLVNHPSASECYAWSEIGIDGRAKHHRVFLRQGLIDSPSDAVRAALLTDLPGKLTG
jgi:hypothetical protein